MTAKTVNKGGRPKRKTKFALDELLSELEKGPSNDEVFWCTKTVHDMINEGRKGGEKPGKKKGITTQTVRNNLKAIGVITYKDFRKSKKSSFGPADYEQIVKKARNRKAVVLFLVTSNLRNSGNKKCAGKKMALVSLLAPVKDTRFRLAPVVGEKVNIAGAIAPLLKKERASQAGWAWEKPRLILVVPSRKTGGRIDVEDLKALEGKYPERLEVIEMPYFDHLKAFAIEQGWMTEDGEWIPSPVKEKSPSEQEEKERFMNMCGYTYKNSPDGLPVPLPRKK